MCLELKLLRESKLLELFASEDKKSLLEASGVYTTNPASCHVIFDDANTVGCVDLSLEPTDKNHLIPVLNVEVAFEDITFVAKNQCYQRIIEALKNGNKKFKDLCHNLTRTSGSADVPCSGLRLRNATRVLKRSGISGEGMMSILSASRRRQPNR